MPFYNMDVEPAKAVQLIFHLSRLKKSYRLIFGKSVFKAMSKLYKQSEKLKKRQRGRFSGWVVTIIPCLMISILLRIQRRESINIIQSRALLDFFKITWIKPPLVVLIKIKVITDKIFSKIVFEHGKWCSILSIIMLSS